MIHICFCFFRMSILFLPEQKSLLSLLQWKYFWNMCYMIETKYFLLFSLPPRRNMFCQRHPVYFYDGNIFPSLTFVLDFWHKCLPWLLLVFPIRYRRCTCRGQPRAWWRGWRWGCLPSASSDRRSWAETGNGETLDIIIAPFVEYGDIKCE